MSNDDNLRKSRSRRLVALDAARGLAVIGMFVQHFALNNFNASIVSGNTMILFILCSGISFSLMSQRMLEKGTEMASFRAQMLARAVFIDLVGYLLIMLNAPFAVILPAYAALFVLALVLVHCSRRTLFIISAALLIVGPPLMILGGSVFSSAYFLSDIAGGPLSALGVAPVFVAGMALGRLNLHSVRNAIWFTVSGTFVLVITKILAAKVLPVWLQSFEQWLIANTNVTAAQPDPYAIWPHNVMPPLWNMLLTSAPQSGSSFQLLIGLGTSLIVLGLACLIEKKLAAVLLPFAAVGQVALTLYAAQFVLAWVLITAGVNYYIGEIPFGDGIVVLITLLAGWLLVRFSQAPLETLMRRFDRLFSGFEKNNASPT
ncbi:DUF418 domain-containing protein [Paenibacillus sp. MMS20-IR301]|uniref:DUF418 domain-containing protein n=1 Tax=Paenibacillus sp. MMS20-IR301 TaxID=2895946 RepID=UPI0028F0B407|nr:DUF418 domain-containing protein [Paenibacillus sp. MMS20-IR301]WNS46094.1 DUF418 domain-containing protein [Paenibacillus sp. MMS20-IR301]